MSASASRRLVLALAVVAALASCGEPAQWRFGENVTALRFRPTGPTEGVYPDRSVLLDPENPFHVYPLGPTTKWDLMSGGANVAAFYAFATALANEPIGENQFYAAKNLAELAQANALQDGVDAGTVLTQAIAGYQAVLTHFPDSRSYDATGTQSFRLATPAYQAIVALGGRVEGNWVLVTTPDGVQAVHSAMANPDGGL